MVVKTLQAEFLRFSKFLKVQSTAVEIYEKPYVIFELARPARGGPMRRIGAIERKRLRSLSC